MKKIFLALMTLQIALCLLLSGQVSNAMISDGSARNLQTDASSDYDSKALDEDKKGGRRSGLVAPTPIPTREQKVRIEKLYKQLAAEILGTLEEQEEPNIREEFTQSQGDEAAKILEYWCILASRHQNSDQRNNPEFKLVSQIFDQIEDRNDLYVRWRVLSDESTKREADSPTCCGPNLCAFAVVSFIGSIGVATFLMTVLCNEAENGQCWGKGFAITLSAWGTIFLLVPVIRYGCLSIPKIWVKTKAGFAKIKLDNRNKTIQRVLSKLTSELPLPDLQRFAELRAH